RRDYGPTGGVMTGTGRLTTHVLDTAHGRPAAGMGIALYRIDGEVRTALAHAVTNADGRCDAPLLDGAGMEAGSYVLEFGVGAYFSALTGAPSPFLSTVVIRFEIAS